jgi:hypothetical protein
MFSLIKAKLTTHRELKQHELKVLEAEAAWHRELKQLEADACRRPRRSVPQLVGLDLDRDKATWMVPIPGERPCFMQATGKMMQHEVFVKRTQPDVSDSLTGHNSLP